MTLVPHLGKSGGCSGPPVMHAQGCPQLSEWSGPSSTYKKIPREFGANILQQSKEGFASVPSVSLPPKPATATAAGGVGASRCQPRSCPAHHEVDAALTLLDVRALRL